ncbi:protein containg M6 family metalloprotease domain [Longilinea arvoryzae]|uniref:Protein containg M6 family metalloprotease domain n=1 Tax=Longilinea arvoryzae TaxID=360412 RepID=A0A0S7BEN3_9CHLR|nr:M6 family metalloprotease domain-containing protein [Longilinea arvoryzae]GAP13408.1 protein containg M6 family metalloprotease domain [Longilinea arvoryzae]
MKTWRLIRLGAILVTVLIAAAWTTKVSAAPAAPIDIVLTQPDGTTFTSRQWGDEWQNGVETVEGYTVLQSGDGWWVYAAAAPDGALAPALQADQAPRVVGSDSPEGLPLHLRPVEKTVPEGVSGTLSTNSGSQPVLVLLASFSDRAGTYTPASFANLIFGANSSVRDFYQDASFNQLNFTPAAENNGTANDGVIGWLNLGYAHPNTGDLTSTANQLIVKNALIAADQYIDYSLYDTNHDNYISNNELHIIVVVAGYEASYDYSTPAVWAHRWSLNDVTPPTRDGKVLGSYPYGGYAQFGEFHGDHQATIGVMAHELGHDLTWPDLYDIDNSSEGVGNWSIMGSGSWNYFSGYDGNSPAMPDAWLKWYQGWITPTDVHATQAGVSIAQAETNPRAYRLLSNPNGVDWNFEVTSGSGEYFLVENRQLTGYDAGLPGCGLLVWHIDESVTSDNYANANENRPLVKLMEADGLNQLKNHTNRGDAGDPFPGTSNKVTFNYSSTPNSRLYSGADSLTAVTGIGSCSMNMTATLTDNTNPVVGDQYVYLPLVLKAQVNTLPVANAQSVATAKNMARLITLTATDANGDPLAWIIVSNPAHGSLSGTAPNLTYTPALNYTGSDSFTFKVNDSKGDSNVAAVSISVLTSPIRNGTFEAGRDGNWTESSISGAYYLITQTFPQTVNPHSGSWAVWLGGALNEDTSITQANISLSGVRYLHYWYWIASADICGYDDAKIYVNGSQLSSYNLCQTNNTSGWVQGMLDLNSYVGQTISLKFEVTTDSSDNSNFFLDDVSITSSASLSEPLTSPRQPSGAAALSKADVY